MKKKLTGRVLGELESEIMEIIWLNKGAVSVKDITEIIEKKRQIAYTTVMTIMLRLVKKGVLVRKLSGTVYLYKPKVTRDKFLEKAVHGIFSTTVSTLGDGVLSHFIKEIEQISPEKREQLLKALQ